ncbi:hypothetical protein DEU56DRAFT_982614 [Suillus clintonianus]|uniref:uncharacterized protein n=1 Tax=Suillus clintonianus TaxID=1904413 RepID=UPI001B864C82|nr:uncharacterized protein DEU56DRAFT_982614 [Suillus clintonianus]KAG2127950.1 hypothetical protein DEU56DRAFT_982614 [Suillus clintonianus]
MSRASSTSFPTRAPPTSIFSQGTASTAATSDAQVPICKPVAPVAEDLIGDFADDIDDTLEREATIAQGKGKSKVASIFEDNVDFDEPNAPVAHELDDSVTSFTEQEWYSQEPKAPFTQIENRGTLKRKASVEDLLDDEEESMVSDWSMDIEGPDFEDTFEPELEPEPPVVVKKEKDLRTTFSTSVSVVTSVPDSKPPPLKKIKVGASAARAHSTHAIKRQLNVDTVPENMKPRSAYRNVDLPATLQVDQRWAKKYLPTVMLWAGSYEDLWTIPDDVLLLHAQLIFNAVFKELNITIVHGGAIHSLTAQRISEWRSNFGSTGLVIILDFLSRNSDCDSVQLAAHLLADYAFLFEDPDKPSPLTTYRSPFVLQLVGTAHLNAISGYVDVPDLDTHALATRAIRMSGVIALCAAAIERALGMFANKNLKVKDILASSARGKLVIKLPKVLNKVTGKMTNAPFLFSAARWAKVTTSFMKSISSKPAGYVETTVQMARACTALNDAIESPQDSLNDDESEDDERAMLCKMLSSTTPAGGIPLSYHHFCRRFCPHMSTIFPVPPAGSRLFILESLLNFLLSRKIINMFEGQHSGDVLWDTVRKAVVASKQGNYDLARELIHNASEPFPFFALRNARVFLHRSYGLACIELTAGEYDRAESYLTATIEGCDMQGNLILKAFSTRGLGEVAFAHGNFALAAERFAETRSLCAEMGVPPLHLYSCAPLNTLPDKFEGWTMFLEGRSAFANI